MIDISWDYSQLAEHYHQRVPYCQKLINQVIDMTGLSSTSKVCDVGAGTGFLAREFAKQAVQVVAVEPNDEMRKVGQKSCQQWSKIVWFNGQAEDTQQATNKFDMVSFGSSLNVVDRKAALQESQRIVKPKGWFLALWNHRDLSVDLQSKIECYIQQCIPDYQYGTRRQDQQQYLSDSQLFDSIFALREDFIVQQRVEDVITAWASHATLQRQAGQQFKEILSGITSLIRQHADETVKTPFYTQAWVAQFKS